MLGVALRIARRDTAGAARGFHAPRLVACARHLPLAPDERVAPDWLVAEPETAKASLEKPPSGKEPSPSITPRRQKKASKPEADQPWPTTTEPSAETPAASPLVGPPARSPRAVMTPSFHKKASKPAAE